MEQEQNETIEEIQEEQNNNQENKKEVTRPASSRYTFDDAMKDLENIFC